jgi:hypothetical protein
MPGLSEIGEALAACLILRQLISSKYLAALFFLKKIVCCSPCHFCSKSDSFYPLVFHSKIT